MLNQTAMFRGIVHGNTIQLEGELGIPDGQEVTVIVQPPLPAEDATKRLSPGEGIRRSSGAWAEGGETGAPSLQEESGDLPRAESWADRLIFDPSISPGERIIKGTRLAAEALVAEMEQGRGDEEMLRVHPELSIEDMKALRAYARVPVGFRLSFGAWAEDAEDLDRYIESVYERRRTQQRRPIE